MNWWDSLNNFIYIVMGAVAGAVAFLVRKVLTNDKQIALLEAEIKQRNEARMERDENLDNQLSEIRSDIKRLIRQDISDYRNNH
jgi:uncharacterized membrane protein (DUF106 family)